MSQERAKQKRQVNIPSEIIKRVEIQNDDALFKKQSLLSFVGKNRDSGLYRDAEDINSFIQGLRDEWN